MALVVGELTAYLDVDKSGYDRGVAAARAEMQGLAGDLGRSMDDTSTRTGRMVNDVAEAMGGVADVAGREGRAAGSAFADGIGTGSDGADRMVLDVHGKLVDAAPDIEAAGEELGKAAGEGTERGGREAGGKLAQGIEAGLVRNSPLIAAAIAGGLAAGAPAAIAGAGVMFGGIAALALKSNSDVAASWSNLGQDIKAEAASDASVIAPTYQRMAGQIGQAFESLRPQIREAFTAAGPEVESLTDGVISLAQNAVPGLVRSVQAGQPVFSALDHMLGDIGTGVGEMFDNISGHSTAAGTALGSLGGIISSILPEIGDLLGEGAELAGAVLPPIASALGVVAAGLHAVAPVLPEVAAGFAALKVAQAVGGGLKTLGGNLTDVAINSGITAEKLTGSAAAGEKVMTGMGKAANAASALSGVMGPLGIVVGVGAAALTLASAASEHHAQAVQNETDEVTRLYQAQASGAQNSIQATDQLAKKQQELAAAQATLNEYQKAAQDPAAAQVQGYYTQLIEKQKQKVDDLTTSLNSGKKAFDDQNQSLTVTAAKQQSVADATAALGTVIQTYGANSDQAKAATDALKGAQAVAAQTANDQASALSGLNAQLVQQAALSLAQAGNDLAVRESLTAVDQAFGSMNKTLGDSKSTTDQVTQSQQQFEGAILNAATAAGTLATNALPAATDATTKQDAANAAQLSTLLKLRDQYGKDFPASLQATIGHLQGTVSAGSLATAQFGQLGLSVKSVPDSKTVIVSSTSPTVDKQLQALGFTVTHLPDGTVKVTASTGEAQAAINSLTATRTMTIKANVQYTGSAITANGRTVANAAGNIVHAYAAGGLEPMAAGSAQIVPPNTWRIIGDRVSDDEAYIPINSSSRSQSILATAANRMGYGLVRGFADGGFTPSGGPAAALQQLAGLSIAGRLEIGGDGLATIVDGRIVQALVTGGTVVGAGVRP